MLKKSSSQRKSIRQSIQKTKVGSKKRNKDDNDDRTGNEKFLGLQRSKISALARKCFKMIATACENFHLIGFERRDDEFVPFKGNAIIRHYVAITGFMVIFMQKIWFTLEDLIYRKLRAQTFFGLGLFSVHFLTLLIGAGVVMRPKETTDVLNSWSHMASCMKAIDPNFKLQPFSHLYTSLKMISAFFAGQAIVVACTSIGFVWSDMPQCLVPMFDSFGLLPTAILPRYAWQILFTPLEFISFLLPIFIITFSVSVLFMGNGALNIYLQQLGRFHVNSLESRETLEQLYVELELFNRIFQVWFRFFFPGMLFGCSCAIILLLFFFIRYPTLPLLLWLYSGYSGATIALILFWQCYDQILVTRASEDILGALWRHHAPYFKRIERQKRIELMKRAKAMKPVVFLLADSEFSLSVPIGAWDEIINQILFLLSL